MCVWACILPLESVLLAMIHSQFVYSFSIPISRPPPFLPHISPFLYPAGKKNRIIKDQMYKWQLCWCKGTQAGGPNVWSRAFAHLDLSPWVGPRSLRISDWILWYHNGCMWRGWWDSKGSLKQEVAAVDPHRRLLYRLTWMYPSPYAPIACPSMPSSFISLFLFLYHSVLYFSWGFVSFWVIWRK